MPTDASTADPWDDWESEDYGRGVKPPSDEASANARLWQVANNSLSIGPSPVLSGNSSANHNPYSYAANSPSAPAAAFVPSLKILKRPSNASASNSANSQAARDQQKKTLKDRERAYNEARNRIFGASSGSAPSSAPQSGASSPVAKATSPTPVASNTAEEVQDLASSVDSISLESSKRDSNRGSKSGKPRPARAAGMPSSSLSTSSNSRPSTPSSTIIREPINPPHSAEKNSSAKVHLQARGFSSTKKPKILSPSATAFVPGSFMGSTSTVSSQQAGEAQK